VHPSRAQFELRFKGVETSRSQVEVRRGGVCDLVRGAGEAFWGSNEVSFALSDTRGPLCNP